MSFFKIIRNPDLDHLVLPKAFVCKYMKDEYQTRKISLMFHDNHTWNVSVKQLGSSIVLTDGWKDVVDFLCLVPRALIVFTPSHPVCDFMLTTFNCDFRYLPTNADNELVNQTIMEQVSHKNESFCYVIQSDHRYYSYIPKRIVMKELSGDRCCDYAYKIVTDGGYKLKVDICKDEGHYRFGTGWSKLLKETPIQHAFFSVFKYIGASKFRMTLFGANGIEIEVPAKIRAPVPDACELNVTPAKPTPEIPTAQPDSAVSLISQTFTATMNTKFRLPVQLSTIAKLRTAKKLKVMNFDGTTSMMDLRREKSLDRKDRFAVKHWGAYMQQNGISTGQKCNLFYHHGEQSVYVSKI